LAIGGSRTTLLINELFIFSLLFYYLFFLVENNILLLFLVSGTGVSFVAVGFLRKNPSHELDIRGSCSLSIG
jgi:hypothetical protein